MLNVVALQGRLARDPELRQTATGKSVATFTLAVDRGRKDASGKSLTDWVPIIAWESRAEFAYKWLTKGQMVAVDGRLQSRTYQAKDGTNRTVLEVVATISISVAARPTTPARPPLPRRVSLTSAHRHRPITRDPATTLR